MASAINNQDSSKHSALFSESFAGQHLHSQEGNRLYDQNMLVEISKYAKEALFTFASCWTRLGGIETLKFLAKTADNNQNILFAFFKAAATAVPLDLRPRIFTEILLARTNTNATQYLISDKGVDQAFKEALKETPEAGHTQLFIGMIGSDRFAQIPQSNITQWFWRAANQGHRDVVQAIINSNRFAQIPLESLGLAFSDAAKNGHEDIVSDIKDSGRFSEINRFLKSTGLDTQI